MRQRDPELTRGVACPHAEFIEGKPEQLDGGRQLLAAPGWILITTLWFSLLRHIFSANTPIDLVNLSETSESLADRGQTSNQS